MSLNAPAVTYLAQAASAVGWSLVVIVLVVGGFAAIAWLRKWMKEDDVPSGGAGFGLGELRRMHARGDLTDEEYERARSKMTASAKAITANMPDPAGGRRAPGTAGTAGAGGAGGGAGGASMKQILGINPPPPAKPGGDPSGGMNRPRPGP